MRKKNIKSQWKERRELNANKKKTSLNNGRQKIEKIKEATETEVNKKHH